MQNSKTPAMDPPSSTSRMQSSKAPAMDPPSSTSVNNENLIYMFDSFNLGHHQGNSSSSSSAAVNQLNNPLVPPSYIPVPAYQSGKQVNNPLVPSSYNPVPTYQSREPVNRGPFTKPPPFIYTPVNYNHFSYNGPIYNPQVSVTLPYQRSHVPLSSLMTNKFQDLNQFDSTSSMSETEIIIYTATSRPGDIHSCACDRDMSLGLRKLIKRLKSSSFAMGQLTKALALDFLRIARDSSGRRVIQECFQDLSFVENEVLCYKMKEHFFALATHPVGCILLNECIPIMGSARDVILECILENCQYLAQHYYGTYVVQNAISMQHPKYTLAIVERLRGMILYLAIQKEGSHLVEKCLGYSSTKRVVMAEIFKLGVTRLRDFACHEFGNFVIQKALSPAIGEDLDVQDLTLVLHKAVNKIQKDLQSHPVGRNVYKKYKQVKQGIF